MTAARHSTGHADPTEQRDQQRPVHLSQLTETVPHAATEQRRPGPGGIAQRFDQAA
jgi:hypothetical protein